MKQNKKITYDDPCPYPSPYPCSPYLSPCPSPFSLYHVGRSQARPRARCVLSRALPDVYVLSLVALSLVPRSFPRRLDAV